MKSIAARVRPVVEWMLVNRAAIPVLTAFCAVAGTILVVTDYSLNNEGLLTHYWASWARQEFAATFYYQKVKPVLAALYAPISGHNPRVTMFAHVLVAATAIPMLASTARSLEQTLPNFASFIVALSPVFFYGGPAGVSNVDGAVGVVLVLYLLSARRMIWTAGLIAGMLPWVRFELVSFAVAIAIYALITPGTRRLLVGMAAFPAVYILTGAVYHADPLWLATYPASSPFDAANPIFANQRVGLRYFLEPATVLTPAVGLLALLSIGRLRRLEKVLLGYVVVTAVVMNLMQTFRVGNFGDAPRYMLHLLPALALLLARAVEPWWEGKRPSRPPLVAALVLVVWVASHRHGPLFVVLIAIPALALLAAWRRAGAAAVAVVLALVLAAPLLPFHVAMSRPEAASYLAPMVDWLASNPHQVSGRIYTNSQLLFPHVGDRLGREIYFIAGVDTERELIGLTNPDNGQRAAIRRLCHGDLYGSTLLPPFAPDAWPEGSILALRKDPRLFRILPDDVWLPRTRTLADEPEFRIMRLEAR